MQYLRAYGPKAIMINLASKIIVGITQRVDHVADRSEFRDALDQRLVVWVTRAGYLPVAVPNMLFDDDDSSSGVLGEWLQTVQPKALLLSGGNDIGEYPVRDATEHYLLSWAQENQVPVLGVCRGMQLMAVWAGGGLKRVEGHVCTQHVLHGEVAGEVNSYHDFSLASCPPGFEVLANSEDGEIEAIRHAVLPWEGWMWHPEREDCIHLRDTQRLQEIFK